MSVKLFGNTSKKGKLAPRFEGAFKDGQKIRKMKTWKKVLIGVGAFFAVVAATLFTLHAIFVEPPDIIKALTNGGSPSSGGDQISINSGSRKSNYLTFLLCGTDEGNQRTDTIMVASYDIDNKKINIVSVPRDSMLNVTWSVKKINSAYAYDGIDGLNSALTGVLGFKPDYYAVVDLKAFRDIVNAIGGVKFDVPEDMYYEDPTQDLLINLKAGEQTLDGEKAMELIRYRGYAMADIQRIKVQQQFMKAVFSQLLTVGNITKVNEVAGILSKYMKTNLTAGNILWLGEKMLSVKSENVSTYTLPGSGASYDGGSYWCLDADGVLDMVNTSLYPGAKNLVLNNLDIVNVEDGYIVSRTGKTVKDTDRSSYDDEPDTEPEATPTPTPSATPTPTPSTTPKPSTSPSTSPSTTPKPSTSPAPSTSPVPSATPKPSATPAASPKP